MMVDLIVIGGGAAGMAAAISAAEVGDRVLTLEAGDRVGKKILASGNGRCNLMNTHAPRYNGDAGFAGAVLRRVSPADLRSFWRRCGLFLAEETEGRVYPCSFQSSSVVSALQAAMKRLGVEVVLNSPVNSLRKAGDHFMVQSASGERAGRRVLVAAGGLAQVRNPEPTGYSLLAGFGHRITDLRPALTPILTDRRSVSGLSGIRVRCNLAVVRREEILHQESGEALFTDYGVSGICAMQCARYVQPGCEIWMDLLGRVLPAGEEREAEFRFRARTFAGETPESLLNGLMVPRLSYAVCKQAGLPLRGETIADLTADQIHRVAETAACYRLQAVGIKGFEAAQVTRGGAICGEFDPANMESRLVPGLHAAGEVLDVDGDCGGFNLMFAFAGGILAGRNGR